MTHNLHGQYSIALDIAARHSVSQVHLMSKIDPWCKRMHGIIDRMARARSLRDEDLEMLREEIEALRAMVRQIFADIRSGQPR